MSPDARVFPSLLEPRNPTPQHPRRSSSSAEIIQHLIHIHHRSLGERLHELEALFQQVEPPRGNLQGDFLQTKGLFAGLKDELCECMVHEKRVVFPQIGWWEAECGAASSLRPPEALLAAANHLARWHARLLMRFWKLTRRLRDLAQPPLETAKLRKLRSVLSACCDDFDQQLFEEDCLLLPRITGWKAKGPEQERQPCPPS